MRAPASPSGSSQVLPCAMQALVDKPPSFFLGNRSLQVLVGQRMHLSLPDGLVGQSYNPSIAKLPLSTRKQLGCAACHVVTVRFDWANGCDRTKTMAEACENLPCALESWCIEAVPATSSEIDQRSSPSCDRRVRLREPARTTQRHSRAGCQQQRSTATSHLGNALLGLAEAGWHAKQASDGADPQNRHTRGHARRCIPRGREALPSG